MMPAIVSSNMVARGAAAIEPAQNALNKEFFRCGKRRKAKPLEPIQSPMKRAFDSSDSSASEEGPESKRAKLLPSLSLKLPCIKPAAESASTSSASSSSATSQKARAHLKLPFFKIETSEKLRKLEAHILATRVEDTESHNARAITVSVSKFLRASDKAGKANADEVDWHALLRDSEAVTAFTGKLAKAGFSPTTQAKYMHANVKALSWLLMQDMTVEQRGALQQAQAWYKEMLAARVRQGRKSTKIRQAKSALEAKGKWITLEELGQVFSSLLPASSLLLCRLSCLVAGECARADQGR